MSEQFSITIASRRSSPEKLKEKSPQAEIIDVTSRGQEPWIRFSPFYPHGGIPVPFSPEIKSASVEGVWQALKVFEKADVDRSKLTVTSMKGIKRSSRSLGRVLGHRAGINGSQLLSYLEARKKIYLPSYLWILENRLSSEVAELRRLGEKSPLILLDYETNCDITDLSHPLSHAGLVRAYLLNNWPAAAG